MGFDNDCILNIQSLAGEYFCPVCRLLVYPNEALQTQCTHLYCKPCLTYVVSTTRACPYDGYLVTEADSKPLTESNKALAETIGKIPVHCLFHRSGCTWQGPFSECITHCSECAFGNSPVVCNRCSIQILHRQVQEHAQTCSGVQGDAAKENASTATTVASNQTQPTTQAVTATSETQPSQSTSTVVQDPSQQSNSNSQGQAAVQTLPTQEQWYQQYQQYYQQYPGYDPYQQRYQQNYPYQQQTYGQYQQNLQPHTAQVGQQQPSQPYSQTQPQPQPQGPAQQQLQPPAQSHSQSLMPVQTRMTSQIQVQVNQQQQYQPAVQAQSQLLSHTHPNSSTQAQPYPQGPANSAQPPVQHPQMPQYQQSYPQIQISQSAVHSLPQQHHNLRAHPHPHQQVLPQPHPIMQPLTQHPSSHAVPSNQSYPQVPSQAHQHMQPAATHQQSMQVHAQGPRQLQFPQPPSARLPVQSQMPMYQQHQAPVPSHGQASIAIPAQMQSIQPHLQQVSNPIQRPTIPPVVQPTPLLQKQSYGGQPTGQQEQLLPMQSSLRPQGPSHTFQQTHGHSQLIASSSHSVQPHQFQNAVARPVLPTHVQSQPHMQSAGVLQARHMQSSTNGTSSNDKTKPKVLDSRAGIEHDSLKSVNSRTELKSIGDDSRPVGLAYNKSVSANMSSKDIPESEMCPKENGDPVKNMVKEEAIGGSFEQSDDYKSDNVAAGSQNKNGEKESGDKKNKLQKGADGQQEGNQSQMPGHIQMQAEDAAKLAHPVMGPDRGLHQPSRRGETSALQQRPDTSSGLQSSSGSQHILLPGYSSNQHGLLGHDHFPHPRQQPYGPETPAGPDSFIVGKGPTHSVHQSAPPRPYNQGEVNPSRGQLRGPSYIDNRRPDVQYSASSGQEPFGQPPDVHTSISRKNGVPVSEILRDHLNPIQMDPDRRHFDDDLIRFPRPSYLYTEHVSKIGSHFPSSRPFDRVAHAFDDIAARPLNNELLEHYDDRRRSPGDALHPYRLGLSETRVNPVGLIDDPTGRLNLSHTHPDFQGPIPGHGRRHMDGQLPLTSPREYLGNSRGFGGLPGGPGRNFGLEDVEIRGLHQIGNPLRNSFHGDRLSSLPSQARRCMFDGRGDLRMDEQFRDHASFGDFPGNPRFRSFPGHLQPPGELLGGPNHPKPGEPGFRSSFILQDDMDPFDNARKRKLINGMGWCRICKVDCETVENLEIHSQTREHQKMAMDMVRSIKLNAKKHKSTSSNHFLHEDVSRSRNAKSEGRKSKN